MAEDWEAAADEDYDKKTFAGEDDEEAPDAWDVDEEEIKRKEAEKAAQQKAKLAEIQAKNKAKKDAEAKAAADAKKAKEEENDPAAKYRRKAEEEAMAKKRDATLADDLFGGGGDGDEEGEGEEGEWYEEGEEGEEGEWYDEEEDNSKKSKQITKKPSQTTAAPTANKAAKPTTAPAAAASSKSTSLPKDDGTSFKVVALGGSKPATTVAASSSSAKAASSSTASSSIESMPLTNDEQFDVLANMIAKRIKSLAPNAITPSVHSARIMNRLLKPILSAACDVMKLDDVNELKKLSMSLHQQKTTFVKKNPPPTEKAAPVSRSGPGSNTLGRNIRATLNLRDDDDVFAAGVTGNSKNDGVFDDDSFM